MSHRRITNDDLDDISAMFNNIKLQHPHMGKILNRAQAFWFRYGGNRYLFPHGGTLEEYSKFMDMIILMMEIPIANSASVERKRPREYGRRRKSKSRKSLNVKK